MPPTWSSARAGSRRASGRSACHRCRRSLQGRGNDNEWGALCRPAEPDHGADSAIPACSDEACQLELPGGLTEHGHDAADRFWMGFAPTSRTRPSASNTRSSARCRRAGTGGGRWGLHGGDGVLWRAQRRRGLCHISHAEFGPRGLRREFVLFDEAAIWKQIVSDGVRKMGAVDLNERIVRYGDLVPCRTAFIDAHTPGSSLKENFTIIGEVFGPRTSMSTSPTRRVSTSPLPASRRSVGTAPCASHGRGVLRAVGPLAFFLGRQGR